MRTVILTQVLKVCLAFSRAWDEWSSTIRAACNFSRSISARLELCVSRGFPGANWGCICFTLHTTLGLLPKRQHNRDHLPILHQFALFPLSDSTNHLHSWMLWLKKKLFSSLTQQESCRNLGASRMEAHFLHCSIASCLLQKVISLISCSYKEGKTANLTLETKQLSCSISFLWENICLSHSAYFSSLEASSSPAVFQINS